MAAPSTATATAMSDLVGRRVRLPNGVVITVQWVLRGVGATYLRQTGLPVRWHVILAGERAEVLP